jgi:hypothetical protein
MDEVPVRGDAVARRVLAHRGDADAVGQHDVAQFERFEQMGHGPVPERDWMGGVYHPAAAAMAGAAARRRPVNRNAAKRRADSEWLCLVSLRTLIRQGKAVTRNQ